MSSTLPAASPLEGAGPIPAIDREISAGEVDQAARWPVTALFLAAFAWLAAGVLFTLFSSIKLHAAGFLGDSPWLTYGRIRPAATNMLVFGFASQAGLAVGLWILCRLGRALLQGPILLMLGAAFWNLGVLVGVVGILAGDATGLESLELPRSATPLLFFSYMTMAVCALLTFRARTTAELYPSQWFVLGALLWFPWIYGASLLTVIFGSVRGVLQPLVAGWTGHGLLNLWLAPLGVAALLYFVPKLAGRPLHSRGLAGLAFWLLAIFGSMGGIPVGLPVPRWIPSLSVVGTVFAAAAVVAVVLNLLLTLGGDARASGKRDSSLRFFTAAAGCYLLASVVQALSVPREAATVAQFTLVGQGVFLLQVLGFLGLTLVGAAYHILARLHRESASVAAWENLNFLTLMIGVALATVPLLVGGWVQGTALLNPAVNFLDVVRRTVPFLGTSTLGLTLILVASVVSLVTVGRLVCSGCCSLGSVLGATGERTSAGGGKR